MVKQHGLNMKGQIPVKT